MRVYLRTRGQLQPHAISLEERKTASEKEMAVAQPRAVRLKDDALEQRVEGAAWKDETTRVRKETARSSSELKAPPWKSCLAPYRA